MNASRPAAAQPIADLPQVEQLLREIGELRAENERLQNVRRYGLVWEDQEEHLIERARTKFPLLIEEPALQVGASDRPHLLIEGDNFHALTALSYTHKSRVDLIYIDPPYNTEDSGFIYNDCRIGADDGYRHSKWLSWMANRLSLATDLLTPSGVMLISIDENELGPLLGLCDSPEIFGPGHLLGIATWIKRTQPTNSGRAKFQLQQNVEYVLAYSKCLKESFPGFLLNTGTDKTYPHSGAKGACRFENILTSDYGRMARETMKFPILGRTPPPGQRWKIGEKSARELEREGRVELVEGFPKKAVYPEDEANTVSYKPFWSHLEKDVTGTAQSGKKELDGRIGKHHFDTVKPVGLLKELIAHFPSDITVLDFFAGSGTTGEAVAALNAADGGSRQAILCTNNEADICRTITLPRLRAALEGFHDQTKKDKPWVEGLGGALRFFNVEREFVERSETRDEMKLAFRSRCHDLLRIREDCFTEIASTRDYALYRGDQKLLAILWRPAKQEALLAALAKHAQADQRIAFYVFSLGGAYDPALFQETFKQQLDVQTIPEELLRTYERIMRRRRYGGLAG